MELEVLLTYDDRRKSIGGKSRFYHREYIGIGSELEKSIQSHIYPNPGKWEQLVINFPKAGTYIISVAKFKDKENDYLVAFNKGSLTKLGKEIVDAGLEKKIEEIYDGENTVNPIVNHLSPEYFAKLTFDYDSETKEINFVSGTVKLIHPDYPNGLGLSPKVELKLN